MWLKGCLLSVTSSESSVLRAELPLCCDLWPTQQKSLTSVLFPPGPSGTEAPPCGLSVDHTLTTTFSEGNQRVAIQKLMDGAQLPTLHGDTTLLSFSGCRYFNFWRARSCCFYLHTIKYLSPESRGSQIPHNFDGFNFSEHWSKRNILWYQEEENFCGKIHK